MLGTLTADGDGGGPPLSDVLGPLKAYAGASRTALQASQSQATNISVNPTIVNTGQGSPQVNPSVYAPASGSPYANGNALAADPPGYLATGAVRAVPGATIGSTVGEPAKDWTMPALLAGGAALLYFLWD